MPENVEIVQYGMKVLASNLLGIFIILGVGACFGSLSTGIILWTLVLPLRKYAGGYHAKSRGRCFLISTGILLLVFAVFYQQDWRTELYVLIVIVSGIYIFVSSPVGNKNKILDTIEIRVYRRRTRIVLIIESVLFILAYMMRWKRVMIIITMSFSIVGISLIAGKRAERYY